MNETETVVGRPISPYSLSARARGVLASRPPFSRRALSRQRGCRLSERVFLTRFEDLGLSGPILTALAEERHVIPTPIQAQAIPPVLAGRDLLGIAQTGTGKTAAFALPILNHLTKNPKAPAPKAARVLVLSPTRELSNQTEERFAAYGRHLRLRTAVVIGGVPMSRQIRAAAGGLDVLIATPGRLLDLVEQRAIRLDSVEIVVLDEADQMLDMGFIHAIRAIAAKLPAKRQTLFFSATMPREIARLAAQFLNDPVEVAVTPVAKTADKVQQHVMFVDTAAKPRALAALLSGDTVDRGLIFTRTKRGADKVVRGLSAHGIDAEAIHGNKSQPQRERALGAFRAGNIRILVATDIAARGIDVENISHVVNYEMPNIPESYVHRIGRTARAGAGGIAISLVDGEERAYLKAIERLIRQPIPVMQPIALAAAPARAPAGENGYDPARPAALRLDDERRDGRAGQNGSGRGQRDAAGRGGRNSDERRPAGGARGERGRQGKPGAAIARDGRGPRREGRGAGPAGPGNGRQGAGNRQVASINGLPATLMASGMEAERSENGKGRTDRIRGRRDGSAPGRELPRSPG